jgi:PAS domain S-box-containing protein/putative nucleotidyltransferase with HDIG domain
MIVDDHSVMQIVGRTMKNDSPKKKSTAGRKSKARPVAKAAARVKNQRAEQKVKPSQSLKEREDKFKYVFDHSVVGNSITLPSGEMQVNRSLCEMLGYSLEEIQNKRWQEITHPDDMELTQREIDALYSGKKETTHFNKRYIKKDGSVMWADLSSSLRRDNRGNPLYLMTTVVDITEHKQAEEEIKKLAKFPDENPSPVLRLDEKGDILYANAASRPLLEDWNTSVGQKAPSFWREKVVEVIASRSKQVVEISIGPWIFSFDVAPIIEAGYVNLYGQDITERKKAEEELRASEVRFRALIEHSALAINITRGTDILYANSNFMKMFGISTQDELKSLSLLELFTPEYRPQVLENIQHRAESLPAPDQYEAKCLRKDRTQFPVLLFLTRTEFAEGGATVAIVMDITEQKKAEEALRASEARFRDLFEDSPVSLWEEDFSAVKRRVDALREEGVTNFREYFIEHPEVVAELAGLIKVVDVNKATLILFGADQKEDMTKKQAHLFYIEQDREFQKELINIAEGKTSFGWEGSNRTLDGRLIHVGLRWSVAPGYEDSLSRVMVSMIDITKRKESEDQVRYQADLLESVNDAIVASDAQYRLTSWNAAAETLYGWKAEEVLGRTGLEITRTEWPDADAESMRRSIAKLGHWRGEATQVRKDGTRFPVELSSFVVHDDSGNITGYVSAIQDITRRKQTEARMKDQLEHLVALREIDRVITSSFDLRYNLTWILESVTKELGLDAADILILNPISNQLEYGGEVGFRNKATEKKLVRPGQSHALDVIMDRQLLHIPDLKGQKDDPRSATFLAEEGFVCYFGLPLIAKGSVKGVLEAYHRSPLDPGQDWLDFLNTLAGQAALAIDNASLFDNLQRSNMDLSLAYDATIEGWSRAMDLRDKETEGHTLRVTELTMKLAGLFGLRDEEMLGIRRGALLHDIGKMGVPDGILLKPDKLTEEEWLVMKKHPDLAYKMLSPIRYLQSAMDIPYCHHEKWNGTGYPRGLKGEQIPLAARIFSVIDVWDALTSDRPYRSAWSKEKTLEYLKAEAGVSFDPEVVKICFEADIFAYQSPI